MRINLILPVASMAGGIRVIAIYAKWLHDNGHDVLMVSQPWSPMSFREKLRCIMTGRGWPKGKVWASHLDDLQVPHKILETCRPVMDADLPDADVVVATWWETAEWVHALSASKGKKVYFIQHYEVHDHLPVERTQATYRLPLKKIVIAQWLKKIMQDEFNDPDVKIVPNAVDHRIFFAPERDKQPVPTIGFLNSPAHFKGVAATLDAIRMIRQRLPSLRILSFGTCEAGGYEHWDDHIEYVQLPSQDQIRQIYGMCDIWLTASVTEGFNLPAMEAMACRTPVVSTRAGWPEEAIENGLNGYLVEVGDSVALAERALQILAFSNEEWRRMSSNAWNTVRDSSWETSSGMFLRALRDACEHEPSTNH